MACTELHAANRRQSTTFHTLRRCTKFPLQRQVHKLREIVMYQMSPAFFKTSINFFGKYHLK